jgi:hypothetical protein
MCMRRKKRERERERERERVNENLKLRFVSFLFLSLFSLFGQISITNRKRESVCVCVRKRRKPKVSKEEKHRFSFLSVYSFCPSVRLSCVFLMMTVERLLAVALLVSCAAIVFQPIRQSAQNVRNCCPSFPPSLPSFLLSDSLCFGSE